MSAFRSIVAKHSPRNGCHAEEGEELFVANIESWPSRAAAHHFVGSRSGKISRYGWIAEAENSPDFTRDLERREEIEGAVHLGLRRLKLGDAVALDFVARGIPPTIVLSLHKVFFYPANPTK